MKLLNDHITYFRKIIWKILSMQTLAMLNKQFCLSIFLISLYHILMFLRNWRNVSDHFAPPCICISTTIRPLAYMGQGGHIILSILLWNKPLLKVKKMNNKKKFLRGKFFSKKISKHRKFILFYKPHKYDVLAKISL